MLGLWRHALWIVALSLCLVAASCGGGGGGSVQNLTWDQASWDQANWQ